MSATVLCLTPSEVFDETYLRRRPEMPPHTLSTLPRRSAEAVREALPRADLVIGDWTGELRLDAPELERADRCVAILQPTAGYNCIDAEAAAARGIAVANTPGANTIAVAEWVVMAALAMLKGAPRADDEVRQGLWRMVESGRDGVFELANRAVGIVGFGAIGQAVARRLAAFEPSAIRYVDAVGAAPQVERDLGVVRVDIDELFERSDIVTLHVPLTPGTRGLVDARRLASLGPDGVLVNTARGGVVDSDALEHALLNGVIKAAALDVFDEEPLPSGHRWSEIRNALLSPHLAGSTNESRERMIGGCLDNVIRVLRREPPSHIVNGSGTAPRSAAW